MQANPRPPPAVIRARAQATLHNSSGLDALTKDDFSVSIAEFSRAIMLMPEEPSFYWHRAEVFIRIRDFGSALVNFRQHELLTSPPVPSSTPNASKFSNNPSLDANNNNNLLALARNRILRDASNSNHRSATTFKDGPHHKSISHLDRSVALISATEPDHLYPPLASKSVYVLTRRMAYVSFAWGQILLDQQRFSDALVQFATAQKLRYHPESVFMRIAFTKIGLGEIDDAMEILYSLIDLDPHNADFYILRSKLYKHLQNVDFAHIDLQHAIRVAPNHPEIPELRQYVLSIAVDLKNKASEQILKKQPNTAVWYYNHAIELDPDDWSAVFRRGVILAEIHNYEGALEDLHNVLSNPNRDTTRDQEIRTHIGSIYNKIGIIAYQATALDEALTKFTTALTFNATEPVVWKNRADCFYRQGDLDAAVRDFEQCYRLAPTDGECRKRLAGVYAAIASRSIAAGRYHVAINELDKAIMFDPTSGEHYYERGRAFYFLDHIDDARTNLIRALTLSPGHQPAQAMLSLLAGAPPMGDFGPLPKRKPHKKAFAVAATAASALASHSHGNGRAHADAAATRGSKGGPTAPHASTTTAADAVAADASDGTDSDRDGDDTIDGEDAHKHGEGHGVSGTDQDHAHPTHGKTGASVHAAQQGRAVSATGSHGAHVMTLSMASLSMLPPGQGGPNPAMLARESRMRPPRCQDGPSDPPSSPV